jgi:hypothetical protein
MTALVISLDLLISLICLVIAWQLILLQSQIVALVTVIDDATLLVEQLGLVPTLLADRQQQLQQIQQLYQQPLGMVDSFACAKGDRLWQLGWQLVRLLLWVRTRR